MSRACCAINRQVGRTFMPPPNQWTSSKPSKFSKRACLIGRVLANSQSSCVRKNRIEPSEPGGSHERRMAARSFCILLSFMASVHNRLATKGHKSAYCPRAQISHFTAPSRSWPDCVACPRRNHAPRRCDRRKVVTARSSRADRAAQSSSARRSRRLQLS